jgi:putative transposase
MSAPDCRAQLDRDHGQLSIRRQYVLLGVARSGVYRPLRLANDNDVALTRRIDALGPKPRTTVPAPGHKIFPYLLRGLAIERPNQVWAADIASIPIGRGFLYLVAIMDGASRAVLAWRLSNTMDTSFCAAALEEAPARFGRPEIFNTDQGSRFTGAAFTGVLIAASMRIPMDGRGRWMDNVFSERLWRSLKHEDIYLKGHADGRETHAGILVDRLLQHPTAVPGTRQPDADGGLADGRRRRTRRHGCEDVDIAGALPTFPQPPQEHALIAQGLR